MKEHHYCLLICIAFGIIAVLISQAADFFGDFVSTLLIIN